jgi:hypothetical protein
MDKIIDKENVIEYSIINRTEDDPPTRREIVINGCAFSVYLASSEPEENMDYLSKKSMEILKLLKEEQE